MITARRAGELEGKGALPPAPLNKRYEGLGPVKIDIWAGLPKGGPDYHRQHESTTGKGPCQALPEA